MERVKKTFLAMHRYFRNPVAWTLTGAVLNLVLFGVYLLAEGPAGRNKAEGYMIVYGNPLVATYQANPKETLPDLVSIPDEGRAELYLPESHHDFGKISGTREIS